MTMLKRVAAVLLALATLLTFAACRTKDEAAFTFSNGTDNVKIKTALYMCYLIDATGDFQSEYDTQAAETTEASEETTTAAATTVDYQKATVKDEDGNAVDYVDWVKAKAKEYCAEHAYYELEFDRLGLEINDETAEALDYYASYYWDQYSLATYYEPNGVTYNTYLEYYTNSNYKKYAVYDFYYGEKSEDTTETDSDVSEEIKALEGSLRPADDKITKALKENFVLVDHVSISFSYTDEDSGETVDLTDDEKADAMDTLKKYADRINAGESFADIYEEYCDENGIEPSETSLDDSVDATPLDKYSTVLKSADANNGTASDNYDLAAECEVGKAVVKEEDSAYHLFYRFDITKDPYYSEYCKDAAIEVLCLDEFESNSADKAAELDCNVNSSAIRYYSPKKIVEPES